MSIKLKSYSVIEESGQRFVEATYACDHEDEHEHPHEFVQFRIQIPEEGYPRIAEAQLEALQIVRNVIGDEILRLERIRGRVD